ncbi:MAG TPA: class I SAM-dependent methyltransferase [Patescibacteria group bacterium]|nr:class I SAM-dependent methyltransferase [Patescibacteria group bacterium]
MQQNTDQHWSNLYDQGRDYLLASHQAISKYLERVDPPAPKTVLDIGCGTDQLTRELYHRGYRVVGVDVSTSAISTARISYDCPIRALSRLAWTNGPLLFEIQYWRGWKW